MKFFVSLFILCNAFFGESAAFNSNVPCLRNTKTNYIRTYSTHNLCMNSEKPKETRRDVLTTIGTIATLGSLSIFSSVNADTTSLDNDIPRPEVDWTTHKGPFSEDILDEYTKTASGLLYKDVEVGNGPFPNDGDAVTIQMVGYIFETGEKWCNTYKGIPAFQSVVRAGTRKNQKYMKGLNEGVVNMRKGGKRILVIPAYLAYSYTTIFSDKNPDVPIIPGGSNLVCYVEVQDFKKLN